MNKFKLAIAIGLLALSAWIVQAVEDGLGTNVVNNLRVKTAGTLSLGAVAITNWGQIESTNSYTKTEVDGRVAGVSNGYINADAALDTSINGRIIGVSNDFEAADSAIYTAYRAADGGISNDFEAADSAIYAAYRAADGGISNAFEAADLGISNALALKLDMTGGTATNLTVADKFVQKAGSLQTISTGGGIDPNATFIPLKGAAAGADSTVSILDGATAGQMVILRGTSDADTATLTNGVLADGVPFTFKNNNTMQLIWNGAAWVELNRTAM